MRYTNSDSADRNVHLSSMAPTSVDRAYQKIWGWVKRAGERLGIALRPHELRRYAATFASRSGVPLEVVSKVILRHKNLSTTQRYLGKVTDAEAMKWIDRIYD